MLFNGVSPWPNLCLQVSSKTAAAAAVVMQCWVDLTLPEAIILSVTDRKHGFKMPVQCSCVDAL